MIDLTEGLRVGDLTDLVLPKVSIDEYESKISKDAIVVGFYVDHKDPATDLSSFIEKGAGNILDTEVSPAPDDDGNYLVFVEFMRNEKFPEDVEDVLDSLEALTGIKEWQYNAYGHGDENFDFSRDSIINKVRLEEEPMEEITDEQMESLQFFKPSILDNVEIDGKTISLTKSGNTKVFEQIALGDANLLIHILSLESKPVLLDQQSLYECNSLRRMLGENWDVNKIDNHYILANNEDERIMVIK